MRNPLLGKLVGKIYPNQQLNNDSIERVSDGEYQTNAGNSSQPLFPVVEQQRTLHQWGWARNAPQKGIGLDKRNSGVVATCTQCNATSIMSHVEPHVRYLLGCVPIYIPQPICPTTCQDTMAMMRESPLTVPEQRQCMDIWNQAYRWVDNQLKV